MNRLPLTLIAGVLLAGLNVYFYGKTARFLDRFAPRARRWQLAAFLFVNSPYLVTRGLALFGVPLHDISLPALKFFVYPFYAWVVMLTAVAILTAPKDLLLGAWHGLSRRREAQSVDLSRRSFLAKGAALAPPLLFGISASGLYDPLDLEISPEREIRVRGLPRAFHGFTITQISDLHTGAYIRERELNRAVEEVNRLHSDLIVVTGDFLDISLDMLPVAQQALSRLRADFGVYGVLGNHDYYSDPEGPGCLKIMQGMQQAGVRMLRNARSEIRRGADRMILAGVDWTGPRYSNPNSYNSAASRRALDLALAGEDSGAPRVLLAHHPHVFFESPSYNIALTLAGHTHGGGQIVVAVQDGRPIALGAPLFRYYSGLYNEGRHILYVNRGIGFVGLPLRIHCPPEISRFRLLT